MRKRWQIGTLAISLLTWSAFVMAGEHEHDLPAGPIHDRHELMEKIGDNAKVIGDAMKSGDFAPVAGAAEKIRAAADEILPLFPAVSTHPNSRAKEEIWSNWKKFEEGVKQLETTAAALAEAAKGKGDVPTASKALFGACKSCHDQFRKPEEEKG
jgi:cytochrome c556